MMLKMPAKLLQRDELQGESCKHSEEENSKITCTAEKVNAYVQTDSLQKHYCFCVDFSWLAVRFRESSF